MSRATSSERSARDGAGAANAAAYNAEKIKLPFMITVAKLCCVDVLNVKNSIISVVCRRGRKSRIVS